jgi:hypothetical protein
MPYQLRYDRGEGEKWQTMFQSLGWRTTAHIASGIPLEIKFEVPTVTLRNKMASDLLVTTALRKGIVAGRVVGTGLAAAVPFLHPLKCQKAWHPQLQDVDSLTLIDLIRQQI